MADVTIDSTINTSMDITNRYGPVWVSRLVGYTFYRDSGGSHVYSKTTDGGSTWGTPVTVTSDATSSFAVWFDKWTPNDTGTIIHIAWSPLSSVKYNTLNTSSDSLGTAATVRSAGSGNAGCVSVCKAEGGNLYIMDCASNSATFDADFYRSTDGGSTWTQRSKTGSSINDDVGDGGKLIPANRDDTNDIGMWYFDSGDNRFKYQEYDDSADSWSSTNLTTASGTMAATHMEVSITHSDKHAHVFWSQDDGTLTIHHRDVEKIGGTISGINDVDTPGSINGLSAFVNQQTDTLYCAWVENTAQNIEYSSSSDSGTTWAATTTYSDATGTYGLPSAGISVGTSGGRFEVTWRDITADDWLTNFTNSLSIDGSGDFGQLMYIILPPGIGPA